MPFEPSTVAAVMDCTEFRRAIDSYVDGEFDDSERAEAEAHLARCPPCLAFAEAQARVRHAIRAKLQQAMGVQSPAGRAPEATRDRIRAALARERRPLWRRALSPVPLAAAAACAAGALVVLVGHGANDALVNEAVAKHNRDLPLEVMAASVGPDAIWSWFDGKLDFHPAPPRFRPEVRMVGARLSQLREWPAAYVRYALPSGQAGLFIVDDPAGRFEAGGRELGSGAHVVRLVAARGYNVAVWRQREIVYSLVSDLDEKALFQLVRAAQADQAP